MDGSKKPLAIDLLVASLDRYKRFIDLELIYDSNEDFLYRQKGQLKLDNTILEEFLPRLVGSAFSDRLAGRDLMLGPTNAFSQLHFDSNLRNDAVGGGMKVRAKDHDFALSRPLFLQASHHEDFRDARREDTRLAYIAAEIKTNLDKTMFQEAAATANDLKLAMPSARCFLLCEWLDMAPISTELTAIEEVIVLRKARRLPADLRAQFATASGRAGNREAFAQYLHRHPLDSGMFQRFLSHVERLLGSDDENEQSILKRGWF